MAVSQFAVFQTWLFLGTLLAIVAIKLLTGGINNRYLLYGRTSNGRWYYSSGRLQLLVLTLGVAGEYLLQVAGRKEPGTLPDVPTSALALLAGSQIVYLSGKAYSMIAWRRLFKALVGG